MLHQRKLISIAIGTVFLLTFGAASVSAADKTDESEQHTNHGDMPSNDHHGHQCKNMMPKVDMDKDGKISRREFMSHHGAMFDKKDTNKDGFLDESEMGGMMDHMHEHKHDQKKDGAHSH